MKKVGKGTPVKTPQILHHGLTIYNYEEKTPQEVKDLIQHVIDNFLRVHDDYKFDKLIFGFDDPGPDQHFDLKFIRWKQSS